MEVQANYMQSVGKKIWRFVEVYIFVVISTVSGSAIAKDVVFAKSKARDKTLRVGAELFMTRSCAPPLSAKTSAQNEQAASAGRKSVKLSLRAVEKGIAIEKGWFASAARRFEERMYAFLNQHRFQERARRALPLNLATETPPLLI